MKKHLMMLLMLSWTFPSMAATKAKTIKTKCSGTASFYGRKFTRRRMSNGYLFDPTKLTAANRWLPLGTIIRVYSPTTGKSVDVTITDRGPWTRGRVLDLSYAAAKQLDMVRRGVARVVYFVLPETEPMSLPDGI